MQEEKYKSQIVETAKEIAKVWMALNVHEELFCKPSDVAKLWSDCPRIAQVIDQAVVRDITIGCAAIFTDPAGGGDKQNLSMINFYQAYRHTLPKDADVKELMDKIETLVEEMGLKDYRNKVAAHYDLSVKLGEKSITTKINVDSVRELLTCGNLVLNKIAMSAGLVLDKGGNKCSLDYRHTLSSKEVDAFLNERVGMLPNNTILV
ncbi:hypothetical protein ACJJIU_10595 [Microbulbifer sp. CnH-101-E]|uniref:AbiU2 domain-containing protein n=1 Tax=unclassified Microbulbifer TaxID=2619833 RepID=UPI004039AE45